MNLRTLGLVALGGLFLASALVLFACAGAFKETITLAGPFDIDATRDSHLVSVHLPPRRLLRCCATVATDSNERPLASLLRLWVGDREVGPPHTVHESIRRGDGGFSHWGENVYFALADAPNTDETIVRIRYPVALPRVWLIVPVGTLLVVLLLFANVLRRANGAERQVILNRFANTALVAGAALSSAVIAMSLGLVRSASTISGPFATDAPPSKRLSIAAPRPSPACCVQVESDGNGHASASHLRLSIDGRAILPPHKEHEPLRLGESGFSHWGDGVYFTLPEGIENSVSAVARMEYPVRARPAFGILVLGATFALGAYLHGRRIAAWRRRDSRLKPLIAAAPYLLLFGVCAMLAALTAAFWIAVLAAFARGHALPIAAPFQSELGVRLFETIEPALPLSLLLLCAAGASGVWLSAGFSRSARRAAREKEIVFIRLFARIGLLFFITLAVVDVGAAWAGAHTYTTSMIAGLVPFFDPVAYFFDLHWFAREGEWISASANRPIASALRQTLFYASGLNYPVLLAMQATLLGASLYWACLSVLRWKGTWPAVALLAFGYVQLRSQAPTLMTEPLGLVPAFLSIPFIVRALRSRSDVCGLIGVALLTAALWMRIGSAFTIPALALWFAVSPGDKISQRAIGLALGVGVVGSVLLFNSLQGHLFAPGATGNFPYTLCGLTIGGGWDACLKAYPDALAANDLNLADDQAVTKWLLSKAIENLRHDPGPFLKTTLSMPGKFLRELPDSMLGAYNAIQVARWFPTSVFFSIAAVLMALSLRIRALRREGWFWGLTFLSTLASATLTYFTDGKRVFIVTYVLIALFVALAFSTPAALSLASARSDRRLKVAGLIAATCGSALLLVPLAGRAFVRPPMLAERPIDATAYAIVGGWPQAAGVLVVPDDAALPANSPAMRFSRFKKALALSRSAEADPLLTADGPTAPFGLALMPRYDRVGSAHLFVVPPEAMTTRAYAWRLKLAPAKVPPSMWVRVEAATPLTKEEFRRLDAVGKP